MPEVTVVKYTTQFCRAGYDISSNFLAEDDADMVRFWEGDFCLLEVTKADTGEWEPTGGDSVGWTELANAHTPLDALLALLPSDEYALVDISD